VKHPKHHRHACLAFLLLTLAYGGSADAQPPQITLAWDASPEASVSGYVVYVGSASGVYDEQYDVARDTTFVYSNATVGRPYFFAVAAYAGSEVGERSDELFFLAGAPTIAGAAALAELEPIEHHKIGNSHLLCPTTNNSGCYTIEPVAAIRGEISALTPLQDGRLLFIQDGRYVRVVDGDVVVGEPALAIETATTRLVGLVLDPLFARNRFVYVGEIETRFDQRRALSIVRYRELANVLAERAPIVTGVPLPAAGDAALAMDGSRRLYVAIPGAPGTFGSTSPYDGKVLQFEPDGTVARERRAASPVLAAGSLLPGSLVWSGALNELWLAGSSAAGETSVMRIPLAADPSQLRRLSTEVASLSDVTAVFASPTTTSSDLILLRESGEVLRVAVSSGGVRTVEDMSAEQIGGHAMSGAVTNDGMYFALAPADTDTSLSSLVRLRRR
jgi:hypothetical protein